jgi:ABC-type phosphonate transport system ATPase subunit
VKVGDWQKTYWEDEKGNRTTIQDVLLELQDEPIVSLEVSVLARLSDVIIEQHRKESADLSFPIIVVEKDGEFQSILDGHHRLRRAVDENKTYILAKVIRGSR